MADYVLQWHNLGILALAISILLLPWSSVFYALGVARDTVVGSLGYGIFLVIAALIALGLLLLLGHFRMSRRGLRWTAGSICFALAIWGLLSFLHPAGPLAGVSLEASGAGGRLGHTLTGNLIGMLIWMLCWVAGCFIFWPRHSLAAVRAVPPAAAAAWRLGLHRHAWHGFRAIVRTFTPQE
ncbi:MAG: hypothetical protein ACR2PL_26885, partial [Dehalococcoidia bacterium]